MSFVGIAAAVEINLDEALGKQYKVAKEKDNLACFIPLAIKGIDSVYIKNAAGEVVYLIEIYGSEGRCAWQRDKIVFAKNLPIAERNYITKNFQPKLYFKGNFRLMFRVKRLLPDSVDIKSIKIPYFILINNTRTNEEVFKKDLSINISLPKEGEVILRGEVVSLDLSVLMDDFIHLETLSGIYFKR